jgi:hypothetical protein
MVQGASSPLLLDCQHWPETKANAMGSNTTDGEVIGLHLESGETLALLGDQLDEER